MSTYEIIVTLFTIVFGLVLTDLFSSFHRLIRNKSKIRWHWLPLLASWYLFLMILKNWWDLAVPEVELKEYNILLFIIYGHLLIFLYLLASAALPDRINGDIINLKEYYFNNHRYFWGLMAIVLTISVLLLLVNSYFSDVSLNIINLAANFIFIVLTLLLAFSKKYWLHASLLVFFTVVVLLEIISKI